MWRVQEVRKETVEARLSLPPLLAQPRADGPGTPRPGASLFLVQVGIFHSCLGFRCWPVLSLLLMSDKSVLSFGQTHISQEIRTRAQAANTCECVLGPHPGAACGLTHALPAFPLPSSLSRSGSEPPPPARAATCLPSLHAVLPAPRDLVCVSLREAARDAWPPLSSDGPGAWETLTQKVPATGIGHLVTWSPGRCVDFILRRTNINRRRSGTLSRLSWHL